MPTREEVEAKMTESGGWRRDTLASWGVPWPPPKGWKEAITKGHERYYKPGRLHPNQAFQMAFKKYGGRA